jgi:hypothetical protein
LGIVFNLYRRTSVERAKLTARILELDESLVERTRERDGARQRIVQLETEYEQGRQASVYHEGRSDVFKKEKEIEQAKNEQLTKDLAECERNVTRLSVEIDGYKAKAALTLANIQAVHTWVVEEPGARYPLKIRYQMKNMSTTCADVTMQDCRLNNPVMLKQVISEVLQLKHYAQWDPNPDGVTRVALLPGQEFRGWVAANNTIFSKEQVERLIGNLGTVGLIVDGTSFEVKI